MSESELELRVRVLESALGLFWNKDERRYERAGSQQVLILDRYAADDSLVADVMPDGRISLKPAGRMR